MKQSAVHFNDLVIQLGKNCCMQVAYLIVYVCIAQLEYADNITEVKSNDRLLLEDKTVSSSRPDQWSGQFSSAVEDISTALESLSTKDSAGLEFNSGSVTSTYQSALTSSAVTESSSTTVVKEEGDSADGVVFRYVRCCLPCHTPYRIGSSESGSRFGAMT